MTLKTKSFYSISIRHSFTLIELLVVMSILSVLISLLMPALKSARKTTKSMVCLSNLKQIGDFLHIYANENDDVLPRVWDASSGLQWNRILAKSVGAPDPSKVQNFLFWHCQAFSPSSEDCFPSHVSYSYNISYGMTFITSSNPPDTLLSMSSGSILIADTIDFSLPPYYQSYFFYRTASAMNMIHARHNQKANVVFFGGHGSSLGMQEVLNTGSLSVTNYGGF